HRHRGRPTVGGAQRVAVPATPRPVTEDVAAARPIGVVGLAATQRQGHQEGVPRRLQVADDADAVEAAVQQQDTRADAQPPAAAQQALEDLFEVFAFGHGGQRQGDPLTAQGQVHGGVGVEVAGAVAGLAAVDLGAASQGQAVVGDQRQVDGQPLPTPAQPTGQAVGQGGVEAALQFVPVRQPVAQGQPRGLGRGGAEQAPAGGGQGGQPGGGGQQQVEERPGRAAGAEVGQAQVGL